MNKQGMLITFEGIDGCGKSTMLNMLSNYLRQSGYDVVETREPGDSDFGQFFRDMLLNSDFGTMDEITETLLYSVDRARHVSEVVRPSVNAGRIVVCDRYTDSTLAYQGGGRGLDIGFLRKLNDFATGGLIPTATFYLRIPLAVMETRLAGEKDRLEQESLDFFDRVKDVYDMLADSEHERVFAIDASQQIDQVFADILEKTKGLL